ncbi:MAG: helix-turn-helix domain-containing protein [Candidatus Pacebacteria bacterium]|nr:helix-turn-helix domain-containing protein [Candidatus Paceibacterota bacterium]
MINNEIFENIGLNEKEAKVYLSVLSNPEKGASGIEKETGIGRTYIYDIAQKLVEKGFLRQTNKGGKRVFVATSPKEILENQKKIVSEFEQSIDELENLQNKEENTPQIVYYSGKKELETMMSNFISAKIDKEAIAFSDDSFYLQEEGEHQQKEISKRLKEKVHFRALVGMSNAVLKSKEKDEEENRETRILPKDSFDLKTMLGVHGKKTVVINYKKNFAFVVEDEDLAHTIKEIFENIWDSGKIIR